MKVHCVVQEGTILAWDFQTELPASKQVPNACVHTFVLTSGEVNVIVRMHVRLQGRQALLKTKLWNVELFKTGHGELGLVLTPAYGELRATADALELYDINKEEDQVTVRFRQLLHGKVLFVRRMSRALLEAGFRRSENKQVRLLEG